MKEIRLFIENTSAPYVNKIIFLYVDIFLVQLALCFITITDYASDVLSELSTALSDSQKPL